MDENMIRLQLQEVSLALKRNEEEHEVLVSLVKGYEGWLRLHAAGKNWANGSTTVEVTRGKPKGEVPLREAVRLVLRDAMGEKLHAREIWKRAQAMGAQTEADDPIAITDLTAYSLKKGKVPIEKVGGRTWRWTGA